MNASFFPAQGTRPYAGLSKKPNRLIIGSYSRQVKRQSAAKLAGFLVNGRGFLLRESPGP
jgi:hypothetical protein